MHNSIDLNLSVNQNYDLNINDDIIMDNSINYDIDHNDNDFHNSNGDSINTNDYCSNNEFSINDSINHDIDHNDNDSHSSSRNSINENEAVNDYYSNNEFSSDDNQEKLPLDIQLAQWSVKHQITLKATSDLLGILKQYYAELPKTAEALRMTSKRKIQVKELINGQYVHLGFLKQIKNLKKNRVVNDTELIFDFNFDGISIYKSTPSECWPITARCVQFNTEPFFVGVFFGTNKPNSLEMYLEDLINELKEVQQTGIDLNGMHFTVKFRFICDAPARAYLKRIKGHNSLHGCEKCEQEGKNDNYHTIYSTSCGTLRTDESFHNKSDSDHHNGDSPLDIKLGVGCVTAFPLDPMHLIDLGTVRRFLRFLMSKGKVTARLSGANILLLNNLIDNVSSYLPIEFVRKVRSLKFFAHWKATECRQLLLYIGPVVFRSILNINVYKCFLLLHCGIFIMCNKKLIHLFLHEAEIFLQYFVSYSTEIFGDKFVSYNIHSLLHLAHEVRQHGPLLSFSAYPFENKLQQIKKLVMSTNHPLQQICKRLTEHQKIGKFRSKSMVRGLLQEHHGGPTANLKNVKKQYHVYESAVFILKDKKPDNCICLQNGHHGLISNILLCDNDDIKVVVQTFKSYDNLYLYPIESSKLEVYEVWDLSEHMEVYMLSDVQYKCVCLPNQTKNVIFPLLHLF